MKAKWKQTSILFILIISLFIPLAPLHSLIQAATAKSATTDDYYLTNSIKTAVKSILNEQTAEGTRIIAVVRLYNVGSRFTRVPDLEVRVRTEGDIEYILRPSFNNAKRIQPKETVELSYMIVVDRVDTFSLTELSWVEVDEYVYPKLEKKVLSIPIPAREWRGENAVFTDPAWIKPWGEPFTIPELSSVLEFKTISLDEQSTPQGVMRIVKVLATNNGYTKKPIPDFRIAGKSDTNVYFGKRIEKEPLELESGEQRYLHYAIPAGNKIKMKSLFILIPEVFAVDEKTVIHYSIGQLNVILPSDNKTIEALDPLNNYEVNHPILFDPLNEIIQAEVDISMVALQMHQGVEGGFKVAIAKFKLHNRGASPIPLPKFQAQLLNSSSDKYSGTRQSTVVETLMPNINYVVNYSFILPNTLTGENLVMEILDGVTIAPYKITIAKFKTKVQVNETENVFTFYPYNVNLNKWALAMNTGLGKDDHYKLMLDLAISIQDDVVVDQSYSKMKVEVIDAQGGVIGSKILSFTGENRLMNGIQMIRINSERFGESHSLRIYETIDTPFGQAERLIKTMVESEK